MTRAGLPVRIELRWPFRPSSAGADYFVLHGEVRLEDGGGTRAEVSVHLTQTIREVLPSLEPEEAEGYVINVLRKEVDRRQLEFLKSGKRQPVPLSSRYYSFKQKRWEFGKADEAEVQEFLKRKVFWLGLRAGGTTPPRATTARVGGPGGREASVWVADSYDALYLATTPAGLLEAARELEREGWLIAPPQGGDPVGMSGEFAAAGERLVQAAEEMVSDMKRAREALEKKHEFERG
jgi:hypothetical protein